MRKSLIVLFTLAAGFTTLFADDGGSYKPEDWTYGNIYVKEPNTKIALENEYLYFTENSASAVFDFNNTTKESVTVPCSFPVVIKIPFKTYQGITCPNYNDWTRIDYALWEVVMDKQLFSIAEDEHILIKQGNYEGPAKISDLTALDKSLRVEKYSDYINKFKKNGIIEFHEDENGNYISGPYGSQLLGGYSGCKILQDGKPVQILNVGIEVNVEINPKSELPEDRYADFNDEFSYITLVLHFYHELKFEPSRHSTVTVDYSVVSQRSSYHTSVSYLAYYDISTGGTWKGDMKKFLVASNLAMEIKNGKQEPKKFYQDKIANFYLFNNYKPLKDEYFVFSAEKDYEDCERSMYSSDFEKNDFVTDIKSSSYLKGTYEHQAGDGFSENIKSDYSPKTSFDLNPYNGWVEGVKGDGKGEWIGFTLKKDVYGPFAINGLTRYSGYTYGPDYDSYKSWLENSRLKTMILKDDKGRSRKLEFVDAWAGFNSCFGNSGIVRVNSIKNPSILKAGNYKMEIDEVYKGTKYDDTVLGEVWFIPLEDELVKLLEEDSKENNPIMKKGIETIFAKKTTDFNIIIDGKLINYMEYYTKKEIFKTLKEDY